MATDQTLSDAVASNGSWPAPAKLNLFLHIVGRRADGYHLLQTVFQFLDYGDELYYEPNDSGAIRARYALPGVTAEHDLIQRAAQCLRVAAGCDAGVTIDLTKRLPMGGGLGGGSSDAATTLVALNAIWGCGFSEDRLAEIGLTLGADVPVFVRGRAAWAEGVGERLQAVTVTEPWFLVVNPPVEVETREIFANPQLTRDCEPITIRRFLDEGGENVFEPVVRAQYPDVDELMHWLGGFGSPRLTGSGSCVFLACDSRERCADIMRQLPVRWQGFIARGMNRSPLMLRLDAA